MTNKGNALYNREKEFIEACDWEAANMEFEARLEELNKLAEWITGVGETKLTEKALIAVNQCIAKLEKINGGPVPERTDVLPDGTHVPHVDRYVTELPDGSQILWENRKPVAVKKLGEKKA